MKKAAIIFITLVSVTALLTGLTACKDGDKNQQGMHKGHGDSGSRDTHVVQHYGSKQLKVGDKTVCPVMKDSKFTITKKSLSVEIKGKKYYVCCGGCIDALKKNPDKYLKKK